MAYVSKFTGKQIDEALEKVSTLESSKADASALTALETKVNGKEDKSNKATAISAQNQASTSAYPSVGAVYKLVTDASSATNSKIDTLNGKVTDLGTSKEAVANKVTSISAKSTDTEYPSAKAVYTAIGEVQGSSSESVKSVSDRVEVLEGLSIKAVEVVDDTVLNSWQLTDADGKVYGAAITTYKDRSVESVALDGQTLKITYNLATGLQKTVDIPLSAFVTESEFNKNGFIVTNGVVGMKISSATTSSKYLSFDANGYLQITNIDGKLLGDHNVTNANIKAKTITSSELAAGAVLTAKIADGAVTEEKLGNGAVTTAKIKDTSITFPKLASGIISTDLTAQGKAAECVTVNNKINTVSNKVGTLGSLATTTKTDIVAAINELCSRLDALEGTNFFIAKIEVVETTTTAAVVMSDEGVYSEEDQIKRLLIANPNAFSVGDKITAVGVKGYESNGTTQSTKDLILVVKVVDSNGIKVSTINGPTIGGVTNLIPNIPKGTVLRTYTE